MISAARGSPEWADGPDHELPLGPSSGPHVVQDVAPHAWPQEAARPADQLPPVVGMDGDTPPASPAATVMGPHVVQDVVVQDVVPHAWSQEAARPADRLLPPASPAATVMGPCERNTMGACILSYDAPPPAKSLSAPAGATKQRTKSRKRYNTGNRPKHRGQYACGK